MTPLTNEDFKGASDIIGGPWTRLKALNKVESNGKPNAKLFEPHIFYRELKKRGLHDHLERAVDKRVAHPRWKGIPYKRSQFETAVAIHRECAYLATSWGQFQIMGFNYAICGYENVMDFVEDMQTSTAQQLTAVIKFIMHNRKMHEAYLSADWTTFARMYNGTLYYKNDYHNKLAHWAASYKAVEIPEVEAKADQSVAPEVAKDIGKGAVGLTVVGTIINELNNAVTQLKGVSGDAGTVKTVATVFGLIIFGLTLYTIYRKVRAA